jgi:hypothetical protein
MDFKVKTFIVLFIVFTLVSFAHATQTITGYKAPDAVNLDDTITATGVFTDDANSPVGVLCSFYFYDDNGVLVKRATDQYTTGTGRFTMVGTKITEPTFKRGLIYTVQSECGTQTADYNFLVLQRENIARAGQEEFKYIFERGNLDTLVMWGILGLTLFFVVGGGLMILNKGVGR